MARRERRVPRWLGNLGLVLLLAVLLTAWIVLPWQGVLLLVLALAAWMLATRGGRLAWAATRMGLAGLPQRWGASLVVVVGIAGVVGVLVAMLAMGEGFAATLTATGSERNAILLRGGANVESNSVISREQAVLVRSQPGIARDPQGRPLASAELSQVVTLQNKSDGLDANAQIRGIDEVAWRVRPGLRLVGGRRLQPGRRELVVGQGVVSQFRNVELGATLRFANQDWQVVGVFASGDSHDSELWADATTLASTYNRPAYQSITVRLDGPGALQRLKAAVADDPRLKLDVETTVDYYAKQSGGMKTLLEVLGKVIGAIMAIGAVFGALNSMYAAVAGRAREIATLRALGFTGVPVVVAVLLETMLLALAGGLIGAAIAYALFNNYSVSTLGSNFSQVVFAFKVTPGLLWLGLKWALGIGLIGGLLPALRAARVPVTDALRAL